MKLTFLEYVRIAVFAALGIAMIVYGLAVKRAATGTAFYRVWVLGGVLLLLMAVSCVFRFRQKLPSAVRNAGLAIFIIGCVLLLLTEMLILSHFGDKDQDADWLIVLGAQVFEDRPSLVLKYRLDKAAEYLKSHPDTKCIVSGGKGPNEPFSEAHGMSRYLIEAGISEDRILLEEESMNTSENLENCLKMLPENCGKVGIVTNNFHIFRALRIAKKKGYEDVCGIVAPSKPFYLPTNLLREFVGVTKDLLFGNM